MSVIGVSVVCSCRMTIVYSCTHLHTQHQHQHYHIHTGNKPASVHISRYSSYANISPSHTLFFPLRCIHFVIHTFSSFEHTHTISISNETIFADRGVVAIHNNSIGWYSILVVVVAVVVIPPLLFLFLSI